MTTTRRGVMVGAGLGLGLSACGVRPAPIQLRDVVAAGQPASLLVWAVARERLAGWPRKPTPAALQALDATAADLPQIGALTSGGPPAGLEAIAALRPRLILDYGDVDAEHRALAERLKTRLGTELHLIDGALERTPEAIREAAGLLGVADRAEPLAALASEVLDDWRRVNQGPGFYYARGGDGLETAFHGALATQVLEGAGWTNVAVGSRNIGRVSREQVAAWDPEVVVTLDAGFARSTRGDPLWSRRRNGDVRRLLLAPDIPFGWVDRPPSVNRLLGCAWLAGPETASLRLAQLTRALYGMTPTEAARPRWIR